VCLVVSLYSGLVIVVALSQDSAFAPGQSFVIPYGNFIPPPATAACTSATCAQLPAYAFVQGAYTVLPQYQQPPPAGVDWNLGNPGQSTPTALPVHVTYRPLWQTASGAVDAVSLGLPLDPIEAFVVDETAPSSPPGPGSGPSIGFQASLQGGLYEATLQPDPPFDAAFPPEVENVTLVTAMTQNDEDSFVPDVTSSLSDAPITGSQIPSFSVYRLPDGLAGWQAYLRDTTTLRRVSSVATLGTRTNDCAATPCVVLLPTNHHPVGGDALTGTEIVIAPPPGVHLPTYVSGFLGGTFSYKQFYPTLPTPVTVTGKVSGVVPSDAGSAQTTPLEAELYFEVTAGDTTEGIDYVDPKLGVVLSNANFEYSAETTATLDPTSGEATYSITLAPGIYRVTARPLDAAHQITVVSPFEVDPTAGATSPDVLVDRMRSVQGSAIVADGRFMAGATVDAIPTGCVTGSAASCMPREGLTTTAADGTFTLALDPGDYTLRVEPQSGTSFPWVTQPLLVGPTDVMVPVIPVPAPVSAGVQLFDPGGNAVAAAVVRVFQVPATGHAVEVGRALTDATGTYQLLLAPSSP
jgi:hypothetical protein